ncbi:hypothetical protein V2J09_016881 [Rumex salicifolius]
MALAGLRQIPRSTLLPYLSKSVFSRSSATVPSPYTGSAKVSDRVVNLSVIDPDGNKREIIGLSGQTLLKALTNHGLIDPASHRLEDIDACSAECEVHIAQEWLKKLPQPSYDEKYVLKRNNRTRTLNKDSRLACQVVIEHGLQEISDALIICIFTGCWVEYSYSLAASSAIKESGALIKLATAEMI